MSNLLAPGDPCPWFTAPCNSNPRFHFDSVAGRYIVLSFLRSSRLPSSQRVLEDLLEYRGIFDDKTVCFFGVSADPDDQEGDRLPQHLSGIRFFWDTDDHIAQLCRVYSQGGEYCLCTYILDERLRVITTISFAAQPDQHIVQLLSILSKLPSLPEGQAQVQAPVLVVPNIFEPSLCQALIQYYDQRGGQESGFMREINGKTVYVSDENFKKRRDQEIEDQDLRNAAMFRIHDRLIPEILKAYQFHATRIERHIVACYDSQTGGFFKAHRDNTTRGTAHRKFAVSLNLNTGEYEGGSLLFPEFGYKTYSAPPGGAVVFSCSLLHEATPVTQGRRYAYLPFLYDDEAAKIRQDNQKFLEINSHRYEDRKSEKASGKPTKGFQSRR